MASFQTPQNEMMIYRLVMTDFQRRLGNDITQKQKERLNKTIKHYMNEVETGLPRASIQQKNKEVISEVVTDFSAYINRSTEESDPSRMDVSSRFSQLQNERNQGNTQPPAPPDFRVSLLEDESSPQSLVLFEQIKKAREAETTRNEQAIISRANADGAFQKQFVQTGQQNELVLVDREKSRQATLRESASETASRFVSPDPRRIFMTDVLKGNPSGSQDTQQGTLIENIVGRGQSGQANANMTIARANNDISFRTTPIQQLDNIIRQDDILAYKENEYNLTVYSADRNWLLNKTQNRYDFTVSFDPANNGSSATFSPTAAVKFKNITRIELVKTILPIEGINILQVQSNLNPGTTFSYGTSINTNILSFPYLNIFIPELDTNNFGTNYKLQQAFGSVQYDANWVTDTNAASKGGFLAMIPKFLKCQKIYQPTPLATLQKLTISIQRPDGSLVSDSLDTLDISGVLSSYQLSSNPTSNVSQTAYADISGMYIWINTSTWFSKFMINQGDRVQLQGITFATNSLNAVALADLTSYLQQASGHLVVQIAYRKVATGGAVSFVDGTNQVGYANYIIIRTMMADPKYGSVQPKTYGLLSISNNGTFLNGLNAVNISAGSLINLSHQTTLVFRVITRDMDSTTRLRPDNA